MATRAVNFTNVIDWHIMGDQLVYWSKPGGEICVRKLRGPDGEACKISESTTFRLKEETAGREIITVFVQSLKNHDLLVTARSKALSSANGPDALYEDTILMRVSLQAERMKYYVNDATGESWYLIEEDNLTFSTEFPGQKICRPALGQTSAYFVQNRSTDTSRSQPRFTKVRLADGTILFSNRVPEIKEAGMIHNNGRSFTPELSNDVEASSPGRAIDIPELDRQMGLTKSEDLAIWSDPERRIYIVSTNTGTLLYTYDCCPNSSITMCSVRDGFWYIYHQDALIGRYFAHHSCYFSRTQGRVVFGPPLFQNGGIPALMDDECIDVRVVHERYNMSGSVSRGSRVTLDPFTTFRISQMDRRKYHVFPQVSTPHWMPRVVMPSPSSDLDDEQEGYQVLEARDIPYKWVTLGHGTRTLEAEIPFSGRDRDMCEMVNGYLIYSNTTNDQLLLIDFYPEW